MSSPIIISLYCKGKQQDYKAIFSNCQSVLEFQVIINNNVVSFEGSIHEDFAVKAKDNEAPSAAVDAATLEAVRQQLNQIFW